MGGRRAKKDVRARFGDAVRACRERLGVSQEELAHRAGIHRTYLGDIERGGRNPGLVNICRLAEALEIEPSDIFVEMGM